MQRLLGLGSMVLALGLTACGSSDDDGGAKPGTGGTGIKKYVCVDGGISDNIRPALYGARYEALVANKALESGRNMVTIAGKLCESGDILVQDVGLAAARPGDVIAIPVCGAYSIPMSSNYNALPRPAIAMIKEGRARLIRRRETYQDLIKVWTHSNRWQVIGQDKVVSLLDYSLKTNAIAHAYLLAGPRHVGKGTLATNLAQALNCDGPEVPCGECRSCQRIREGKHADVTPIGLDSRTEIGIDDIRGLQRLANLPPYEGRCKVFIIDEAEYLSTEAANSLLKILEEPPPGSVASVGC